MKVDRANETDLTALVALNNRFAPQGLTLTRSGDFAYTHLADYRVIRDADGGLLGCVALDEYSPSVAEISSVAVDREPSLDASVPTVLEIETNVASIYPPLFARILTGRTARNSTWSPSHISIMTISAARANFFIWSTRQNIKAVTGSRSESFGCPPQRSLKKVSTVVWVTGVNASTVLVGSLTWSMVTQFPPPASYCSS